MWEADCIVVLDTGSTDDTVEKFKEYPEIIFEQKNIEPWDFSVARNEALKLVPEDCNILFSTDLDELLDPGWSQSLREGWIEGYHERGVYKYAWSHDEKNNPLRIFQYDKIHSRNWTWQFPVHECLVNIKTNSNLYDGYQVLNLFDKIYLHHYPDHLKSRDNYLELLELRKEKFPEDYYGLIYLGHEYFYKKRYYDCINQLRYVLEVFAEKLNSTEIASCYLFTGESYEYLGDKKLAEFNYCKGIEADPTYRECYLNYARLAEEQQEWYAAYFCLLSALEKTYRHYSWLERDNSWGTLIWDLLTLAAYYSGNKKESIIYAAKCWSEEPSNERYISNLLLICKDYNL